MAQCWVGPLTWTDTTDVLSIVSKHRADAPNKINGIYLLSLCLERTPLHHQRPTATGNAC